MPRISYARIARRVARLGITEVSRAVVGRYTLVEWSSGHVSTFVTAETTGLRCCPRG